jgi:3-hydroxybutyrate dehydrogenase
MLKEKVAIITGSTSGIGYGIAKTFAEKGCSIILNGLGNPQEIELNRAALSSQYGVKIGFHPADLTKPAEIASLFQYVLNEFTQLHIIVNNAGVQHTSPIESFPDEKWDQILALMLTAPFQLIKQGLPHLRKSGWGRIINIASVHGLVASLHKAAYVSAKHGLVGLTKVVALETAGSGITCNAICPGFVRTPLIEEQIRALAESRSIPLELAAASLIEAKQPSKQFVESDQIGALAIFLCTDAAASITGSALPIDGGWTCQ